MSLYIIEDDDGNVLDSYGYFNNSMINARLYDEPLEPERYVKEYGGHVVKIVEAPAKIVVSEAEAKILAGAKKDKHPCMYIAWKVQVDDEDRLMRAYVIGWEVEKTKQYVLPMEGTELPDRTVAYAALDHTGVWTVKGYAEEQSAITFGSTVTQADIDEAPDWVRAITPVEVNDDEV